jgi:hypothetical protein
MEAALAALLTEPTHARAAATAGISEATLQRWLKFPGFRAAYRALRRELVEHALAKVQAAAGDAVETLRRNLACGHPGSEIRAAVAIIEHAIKAVEVLDLHQRLDDLEALIRGRPVEAPITDEAEGSGDAAGDADQETA